ncbi:MoxR family ATPase [Anabaena sp. UHCC 0204]|uniref:AAA family ATPase n=1 Tax=Anabaena sp. UHCC 0204 TaxID=2590009 RepID=UPI001447B15E|nr:MoxR family ATPase [Anabaena sp. UHCC 0204]MTJ09558.1 MoxR family ATPase [Anabaena sp. UHCC 0204]
MSKTNRLTFTNKPEIRPQESHEDSPQKPEPYVVSEPLKKAVNLAIYLRRPLLLEGDAGCGKTRLASAIAYELGLPLYRWDVRSTTKAQDGLYEYDAILRLHDVQTKQLNIVTTKENENEQKRNPTNPQDYRTFGALGKAFKMPQGTPAVVLIDEIDKADLDFPNDLLTVLDEPWEFIVKETGEKVTAVEKPIVIITSNKEKGNLPAPFLRRCLYHYIEFPNDVALLQEIITKHHEIEKEELPPSDLITNAIARFLTIWNQGGLFKKPGTSEFIDWLKALHTFESQPYDATKLETDELLPYPELLFKLQQDWKKYTKAADNSPQTS